nr:MAG TPA: hypothetical protein [Caudoviricetes sp.]
MLDIERENYRHQNKASADNELKGLKTGRYSTKM